MQELSDDTICLAAAGDVDAFEEVYRATSGFVYNVVLRVLGNEQDAEELVQDVYMTIYNQLKNFRFESSFKTWVYRIAVNQSINRSKTRVKHQAISFDEDMHAPAIKPDVHVAMEEQEHTAKIEQLLSLINPEQKACVVLRNIQGLSYQEIADILKININTVRSRLKRARETMLQCKEQVVGHG